MKVFPLFVVLLAGAASAADVKCYCGSKDMRSRCCTAYGGKESGDFCIYKNPTSTIRAAFVNCCPTGYAHYC
ncbi:unnamed protein product [Clonostachys rosea f. rosea IK726]|uniref:Uncharacterized protein n=2 Tax=Bionectria ochroleuca TaxID=29856 RepID=A0A0B7KGA7_BIOOC|nr:unnamed protein product [Clonostachys rosea f. rosea IK726]